MEVKKIIPRGFCHGVVKAMHIVNDVISDDTMPRPIYILGQIVHNKNITKAFSEAGVITLIGNSRKEILDQVDHGTVIITAHGIDYHLINEAKNKGLNVVDATCSDVYKTHHIIQEKIDMGYDIIYIGKHHHPEPEGVLGIDPHHIHLVEDSEELNALVDILANDKLCITNQTTMSMWDVNDLVKQAQSLFPNLEVINEICSATQERQEAIVKEAKDCDLCIVVGDEKSNNSHKLVSVCEEKAKTKAYLISDITKLDINWLLNDEVNKVGVSSGASTPSVLTNQVIEFIENFDKFDKNTHILPELPHYSKMIPRNRKKP